MAIDYLMQKNGDLGPSTEEVAWWLIHHGVDPRRKSDEGLKPLHTAARHKNETAIRVLIAATGDYSDYDGCLVPYLEDPYSRPRLSTAQNLFAVDPISVISGMVAALFLLFS